MRSIVIVVLESILLLLTSILWCEFGYYHLVFFLNCSHWPEPHNSGQNFTRIMVVADTHIMGPIKSVKLDKMRREWQMKQAFSIAVNKYEPDSIVFLGDLVDEGSFSRDEDFFKAVKDFENIFLDPRKRPRYVIPGNHDVGFHNELVSFPYLVERFHKVFKATQNIELEHHSGTGLNIVYINSMSFYNDSCPLCAQSTALTNRIADRLDSFERHSKPIVFLHIPLYVLDNTNCDYPDSIREDVRKPNSEGKDVMHKQSSKFILERLKPRLVVSGHTHMKCITYHKLGLEDNREDVQEITISSFNHKYAEKSPGFLLLSASQSSIYTRHCNLIEEWVVASFYSATIVIIIARLLCYRARSH